MPCGERAHRAGQDPGTRMSGRRARPGACWIAQGQGQENVPLGMPRSSMRVLRPEMTRNAIASVTAQDVTVNESLQFMCVDLEVV